MPMSAEITSEQARAILCEKLQSGLTITEIAAEIGYARPSLSLYLSGKYPSKSAHRLEAAILNTFCDRIVCPHLTRDIAQEQCHTYRTRPLPQSNAAELKHWLACQRCPVNSIGKPSLGAEEAPHAQS